jgi:hypothetical protein
MAKNYQSRTLAMLSVIYGRVPYDGSSKRMMPTAQSSSFLYIKKERIVFSDRLVHIYSEGFISPNLFCSYKWDGRLHLLIGFGL